MSKTKVELDDKELEIVEVFAKKNGLTIKQAVKFIFKKALKAKLTEFSPTTAMINNLVTKSNHNQKGWLQMDDVDRAQAQTDLELKLALKNRKHELPEVGLCNWCADSIEKGNFCDEDCRNDYEKSKIMKG